MVPFPPSQRNVWIIRSEVKLQQPCISAINLTDNETITDLPADLKLLCLKSFDNNRNGSLLQLVGANEQLVIESCYGLHIPSGTHERIKLVCGAYRLK